MIKTRNEVQAVASAVSCSRHPGRQRLARPLS